jgi:hypothetical protein
MDVIEITLEGTMFPDKLAFCRSLVNMPQIKNRYVVVASIAFFMVS